MSSIIDIPVCVPVSTNNENYPNNFNLKFDDQKFYETLPKPIQQLVVNRFNVLNKECVDEAKKKYDEHEKNKMQYLNYLIRQSSCDEFQLPIVYTTAEELINNPLFPTGSIDKGRTQISVQDELFNDYLKSSLITLEKDKKVTVNRITNQFNYYLHPVVTGFNNGENSVDVVIGMETVTAIGEKVTPEYWLNNNREEKTVVEILRQLLCAKGYKYSFKVTYEGYYKENPCPDYGIIIKMLTGDNFYYNQSKKSREIKYPEKYTADTFTLVVSRTI
jgi:hypothetical protein